MQEFLQAILEWNSSLSSKLLKEIQGYLHYLVNHKMGKSYHINILTR